MKTDFSRASFCVLLHNIPVICMTNEMGHVLGNIIGTVEEVDTSASGECIGKCLKESE